MNNALIGMGVIDEPLALMWNEIGVTIGMVHYMLPLGILPLWAEMRDIDGRVLAASRGLGASATQTFLRVFLPLSLPGVIGAALLVFIFSLGFFITPAILGGGKTIMIAEYINVQIRGAPALGRRHDARHDAGCDRLRADVRRCWRVRRSAPSVRGEMR